jgi:hypothetical protein
MKKIKKNHETPFTTYSMLKVEIEKRKINPRDQNNST